MTPTGQSVAVLIPTHNRKEVLRRVIDIAAKDNMLDEIIVFDDASDPALIANECSPARLLRSATSGFLAAARNSLAQASSSDLLVFLDDDCFLSPGALDELLKPLVEEPSVGMTGPAITFYDAPSKVWCAGVGRDKWTGRTRLLHAGEDIAQLPEVPFASTEFPSVFAVRRETYLRLGGCDGERFPMHMGEASLGDKFIDAGLQILCTPKSVVMHEISEDSSLVRRLHLPNPRRAYMNSRERGRYLRSAPLPASRRIAQWSYWLCVLCPAYILVLLTQPDVTFRERLKQSAGFFGGIFAGLFGRIPPADKPTYLPS